MKDFVIKALGIKTYEDENERLKQYNENLVLSNNELDRQLNIEKMIKKDLNEQIRNLQERLNDPERYWKSLYEKAEAEHDQEYKDLEAWFRHETAKQMEKIEELTEFTKVLEIGRDELWNRAFAQGRMSAYGELGLKVIEIRNEGTTVAERVEAIERGEELPQKQITVKVDEQKIPVEICENLDAELEQIIDEIQIDDLVDVL